jgi:hypothetical protein
MRCHCHEVEVGNAPQPTLSLGPFGCSPPRTTGTVRTDFGSCEIELVGVIRTNFGNTAKSCAIEFAGVNESPCAASIVRGGVWNSS